MDTIWVVTSTTLLVFCLWFAYFIGRKRGYKKGFTQGVKDTLIEWKKTL